MLPTLASTWGGASGAPIADELLDWPPDVFALTNVALDRSEAFRFAVSPVGAWPPARFGNWARAVEEAGRAWGAWVEDQRAALPALVERLRTEPGVAAVAPPVLNAARDAAVVYIEPTTGPQDTATEDLVRALRDDVIPAATDGAASEVHVGGATATARHHFFSVLIGATPLGVDVEIIIILWRRLDQRHDTLDRIARKHGTVKTKEHLTGDEIHVAADLRLERFFDRLRQRSYTRANARARALADAHS